MTKATINVFQSTWGATGDVVGWQREWLRSGKSAAGMTTAYHVKAVEIVYVVFKTMNTVDPLIGAILTQRKMQSFIDAGDTVNITAKPVC